MIMMMMIVGTRKMSGRIICVHMQTQKPHDMEPQDG